VTDDHLVHTHSGSFLGLGRVRRRNPHQDATKDAFGRRHKKIATGLTDVEVRTLIRQHWDAERHRLMMHN